LEIDLMKGYFKEKYKIDKNHNPQKWWDVIDRTTGEVLDVSCWDFVPETGKVVINNVSEFHVYTVNFVVYLTWDSTSMYNHMLNKWESEHIVSVDPYHAETYSHLMDFFDTWLENHPDTDVVRLTSLAYHFTLDSDNKGKGKYSDWLGYTDCVNLKALEDFAKEKGYQLTSEDFIDQGYCNATYRVPSQRYLDWMDFIHMFVVKFGKELVERIHKAGKKAAIFWGDHWIGVEPYSPHFQNMKIDINIGACEDGVALRRIADSPGPQVKEIRLYPYFFPDVFSHGNNPMEESTRNWIKIRRALLRKSVDRIGYGGYLSLASKFPDFVEHVTDICNEFREISRHTQKSPAYRVPVKVAVLNAWGKLRSWINSTGCVQKFHSGRADITEIAGTNVLECLAGLPVEVEFISFSDIEKNGIADDVDIIINDGDAGTSWSGGRHWNNEKVVSIIRNWVYNGGGFIGVREPSAYESNGRFFQLSDILGVQKEIGYSINFKSVDVKVLEKHFICEDQAGPISVGHGKSFVYVCEEQTEVLAADPDGHISMAANRFGKGRSVYLKELLFNMENSRLLYRALLWTGQKEDCLKYCFSSNLNTECAAFPETGSLVIVNNVNTIQDTIVYYEKNLQRQVALKPYESKWIVIK
jgi:1,3-beta-galactosyl-N-acetylhexosamine phosphorylase